MTYNVFDGTLIQSINPFSFSNTLFGSKCAYQVTVYLFTTLPLNILTDRVKN